VVDFKVLVGEQKSAKGGSEKMSVQKKSLGSSSKSAVKGADTKRKAGHKIAVSRGKKMSSMKEQVLNIGSQSSGIGAGKVTFNPF